MVKTVKARPRGGRSRRANYATAIVRVPVPILNDVKALIDAWHVENRDYLSLPIAGSWWAVLGVSERATAQEVKEVYRELARRYHPDRNKRKDAEARFTALNEAYRAFQGL